MCRITRCVHATQADTNFLLQQKHQLHKAGALLVVKMCVHEIILPSLIPAFVACPLPHFPCFLSVSTRFCQRQHDRWQLF